MQTKHAKLSNRRICELVGLSRNAIKALVGLVNKDKPLAAALTTPAGQRPRAGYRMLHGMVRREGLAVGRDHVHRLCRKHAFRIPRQVRTRTRRRASMR